jgi:hypothetical protein
MVMSRINSQGGQKTASDSEGFRIPGNWQAALSRRMSVEEWVRQAFASACGRESLSDIERKRNVIRAAVRHEFPTSDIETMLAEIERDYFS